MHLGVLVSSRIMTQRSRLCPKHSYLFPLTLTQGADCVLIHKMPTYPELGEKPYRRDCAGVATSRPLVRGRPSPPSGTPRSCRTSRQLRRRAGARTFASRTRVGCRPQTGRTSRRRDCRNAGELVAFGRLRELDGSIEQVDDPRWLSRTTRLPRCASSAALCGLVTTECQ